MELKNTSKIGTLYEIQVSKEFHDNGVPLLISSMVLRDRGGGQVDLARILRSNDELFVEILEVKSRDLVSWAQKNRLRKSLNFIAATFSMNGYLNYYFRCADG